MDADAPTMHDRIANKKLSDHERSKIGHYDLVVMAASRGGIKAVGDILAALPDDFPVPVAVVLHRTTAAPNHLPEILGWRTKLKVKRAEEGETMQAGTVYLAPAHAHLMVRPDGTFELANGRTIRHVRTSANPLFSSAAQALNGRVIAVVLTGGDSDATGGVQSVRKMGGIVLAQDRPTSEDYSMPHSAIDTGCVKEVLAFEKIAPAIIRLVDGNSAAEGQANLRKMK